MDSKKEYFAFISYKREDEKWAKWLQNKLEHYKFPTNLNGRTDLPKNIRPTFRDVTDLKPGLLAEEINNALRNSVWLIVVCSPRSAKSPWVCKEAQTFIDLGRADHIIPFVIEGNPFSNETTTECYPEALLHLTGNEELLAANINEMGRDAAVIKVIARMFNLRFDTLWQRYEREQKNKRYQIIFISGFLVLLALSVSGWILYQNIQLKEKDWILMKNQSIAVAEKANELIRKGDSYTARIMSVSVLPENLSNPDRPYTAEAEFASRQSAKSDNRIINSCPITGHSVSINKNGTRLLAASGNSICIWDLYTGALIKKLNGHKGAIKDLVYSNNFKMIASISDDNTVRIWDDTGSIYRTINVPDYWPRFVVFSPDNKHILTNHQIWDLQTGKIISTIKEPNHIGYSSYSPDGSKIVSVSALLNDSCFYILDSQTGEIIHKMRGHSGRVNCAIFSKDGEKVFSASTDKTIRIWDVHTGKLIQTIQGNNSSGITCLAFSTYGEKLVSGSGDGEISVWDLNTGLLRLSYAGHASTVKSVSFGLFDNTIISNSDDETVCIRDLREYHPVLSIECDTFPITSLSVNKSDNRMIATADCNKCIRILNLETGKVVYSIKLIAQNINEETVSEADTYLLESYVRGFSKNGYASVVNHISYSPDNNWIVAALGDGTICVWNYKSGKTHYLKGHKGPVLCASFSSDNKLIVSSSLDHTVRVWDVELGKTIKSYKIAWCYSASFSKDNQYVLASNSERLYLVDINKELYMDGHFLGHRGTIYDTSFSPDGRIIASASYDKTIRIWDSKTDWGEGKELNILKGHTQQVNAIAFNPNGNLLASASDDGTIRIWNVECGGLVDIFDESPHKVKDVKFSSDGLKIISALNDGTIHVWNYPSLQQLIDETRERFRNRQLTSEERKKYYLE